MSNNFSPFAVKIEGNEKYQRLLPGAAQTNRIRAGCVNLGAGQEIGEHITDSREEVIIILSGKAEISSDDNPALAAESNTLIYIPANTRHNVKNIGNVLLRYVYITAVAIPAS